MAKAIPNPKKRRIVIAKPQEDKGDLQISGGEAKLRLTPKLFLTLVLLVAASVSIVTVSVRRSGKGGPVSAPGEVPQPAAAISPAAGTSGDQKPPAIRNAYIVPANPTALGALDIRYDAVDPAGNPITCQFRWFVDDVLVQDGPYSALQPGLFRRGSTVSAEVTPSGPNGTGESFRTAAVTILNAPPAIAKVTLSPEQVFVGTVLVAHPEGKDPDGESVSYSYQWRVNGVPYGNTGTQDTFDTTSLKKRDGVAVSVTPSDGTLSGGGVTSETVFVQNRKPEIISPAPESMPGGTYIYQVVAKDPDGDVLKYRLERAPVGMTVNETSGLIQWSLKKDTMYIGRNEAAVRVTVDDGDGGTASQDFTIVFTDLYVQ